MALKFNPKPYIVPIPINDVFTSIRDGNYPVNSAHPTSSGRFHQPGQATYYFGSGNLTAKAEKYGDPEADLQRQDRAHTLASQEYMFFDCNRLLADHPDLESEFFPTGHQGGWESCQLLRNTLAADHGCSGVIYPSQKHDGGVNAAIWTLDEKPLPADYFNPLD